MRFFTHLSPSKALVLLAFIPLLILSACSGVASNGGTGSGGGSGSGSASKGGPIIVSGKQDIEAQVLSKLYSLLLTKAGFTVTEKLALGDSPVVLMRLRAMRLISIPNLPSRALTCLSSNQHTTRRRIIRESRTALKNNSKSPGLTLRL